MKQSADWLWDGDPDDLMTEAAEDAVMRESLGLSTRDWEELPGSPETKAQHIHAALDRLGMGLDSIRSPAAQVSYPSKLAERIYLHNGRALRLGRKGDLTEGQWYALVAAFDHRCAYCVTRENKLTIEHVVPVKRGGDTTVWNIVPSCRACNRSKFIKTPLEWKRDDEFWIGFVDRVARANASYVETQS